MNSNSSQDIPDSNKTKAQLISELSRWRSGQLQAGDSDFSALQGDFPAQLSGFLQIADAAVILIDSNFRIQLFSAGAESTFGFTFAEVFNRPLDMLLPEELRNIHGKHMEDFAGSSDSLRLMGERSTVYGQRKNGQRFLAEASISKITVAGKNHFAVLLRDISERERAEEALRNRESRLQVIADSLPNTIVYLDARKRYRFTNKTYQKWMELAPEDVKGRVLSEIIPPAVYDKIGPYVERALAGETVDFEDSFKFPDGKTRHFHAQYIPDFAGDGTVRGFSGLVEDITDRKRAEDELLAKERLLETVFAAIPVGVEVKDRQGRYLMTNEAFAAYIGRPPEQLKGLTVEDIELGTPQQRKIIEADDREVMEKGERVEAWDEPLNLPNGKVIWRHKIKAPLFDTAGTIVGLVGVIEDVTKRKEAEIEREEGDRLLRLLTDAVPVSICYIDSDERYRFNNKTMCEWVGQDAETLNGKRVDELMSSEAYEKIRPHIEKVLAGEIHSYQSEVPFPDGNTRFFHASYIPDIGPDGTVRGFSSMVEDITERKKMEELLRESHKMEAVGQLAGGIAHEFNNAMQVILNSAYFIQEKPEKSASVVKFAKMIVKSAERTSRLTQQLLGFSRKSMIQQKILNLGELVSNQIRVVGRLIGEQIIIEHNSDDGLDLVNADPGQLEQIILNLCINACEAMPDGGHLIIETKNFVADEEFSNAHGLDGPGHFVILSVSDNGLGISPENQQHVFEPFFTTKEVGKGTGLGLAMVYGAVQQHGGVIEVFSEPDAGSTFKIFLPAVKLAETTTPQFLEAKSYTGSETVLVAEDDDEVRTLLSSMLESQGYAVLSARDGVEAIKEFKAKQHLIDLVILDMVMPRKHGRDVYRDIREAGSKVPVLFSSGYSPNDNEIDFLSENGLRLIKKPYSANQLFTIVRDVLAPR